MALTFLALNIFSFFEAIDTLQAILFIIGLVLLIRNVHDWIGIAGGLGLASLIAGIVPTARTPFEALIMVLILIRLSCHHVPFSWLLVR